MFLSIMVILASHQFEVLEITDEKARVMKELLSDNVFNTISRCTIKSIIAVS